MQFDTFPYSDQDVLATRMRFGNFVFSATSVAGGGLKDSRGREQPLGRCQLPVVADTVSEPSITKLCWK